MQGNRVHAVTLDGHGAIRFEEGDYGLHESRGWHGRPPGLAHAIDLGAYAVEEHDDLTITVKAVISAGGPAGSNGAMYHGRLVKGVWYPEQD